MLRTEVSRRALSLGRPYVSGFVLMTAVLLLVKPADALDTIAGGVEGGRFAQMPYVTLWFVSALFFTAVLFRAIERRRAVGHRRWGRDRGVDLERSAVAHPSGDRVHRDVPALPADRRCAASCAGSDLDAPGRRRRAARRGPSSRSASRCRS